MSIKKRRIPKLSKFEVARRRMQAAHMKGNDCYRENDNLIYFKRVGGRFLVTKVYDVITGELTPQLIVSRDSSSNIKDI